MSETYIVTNAKGLMVRGKPDTATGYPIRRMAQGEAFTVIEIVTPMNNQKWGRLTSDSDFSQEYACISIGNRYYAKKSEEQPTPEPPTGWALAITEWARSQGYKGPGPS